MIDYEKIKGAALRDVAEFMAVACRTAPKTRGRDNLEILIVEGGKERSSLIKKMKEIAKRDGRPSLKRDADNIKDTGFMLIVGTKAEPLGLNCGFCGYATCEELAKTDGVCAYNAMDLGIALGSAASVAARFHVDNRLMYSIGKAAIELGLFKGDIRQAIGIPLNATGKNPFFDRK
ncbi:DUF2148 domain-containing protein [Omnitrophica bacterium]|nr:DUF2148 domain-containing protein [Candidatus Omnitrophota bacterium]